ncbi:hypothetical protein [Butyricimonas synergistica]|uniref:hypothetical protein n=1 Tax=Butyricimonas synergistica TaxID=544644 RepID=UPI00038176AC|nr:hypothetical protein [Butyricimonas synergistica]
MNFDSYLKREKELAIKLERLTILSGIPLWRIIRLEFRHRFLNTSFKTIPCRVSIGHQLLNVLFSLVSILSLLVKRKKFDNIIFPHPRLFYVNGKYLERFSDFLVEQSKIKESYIILERHQNGIHKKPRLHANKVVYLDMIDVLSMLLKYFVYPYVYIKYKREINKIYELLNEEFHLSDESYKKMFGMIISNFIVSYHLFSPVISVISPKRVFLAPRSTFKSVIAYCARRGIVTYELQHGVVVGDTVLYAGQYSPEIDPNFFLVHGKDNIGTQYGMPLERVINVGYPYKNYVISEALKSDKLHDSKKILVVSDPHVSSKIIDTIILLTEYFPDYVFHIRCHPQEKVAESDLLKVVNNKGIEIVDNSTESFFTLALYDTIIGENSTVLYEAMSLHKRVGRLNFNGLHVVENHDIHGGFVINSVNDFQLFMNTEYDGSRDNNDIYSDYNEIIVNNLM